MNLALHKKVITTEVIDHAKIGVEARMIREQLDDESLRSRARRMGISAMFLSHLERGKRNWTAELIRRFNGGVHRKGVQVSPTETPKPMPHVQVLVFQSELTSSVWIDLVYRQRSLQTLEAMLRKGIKKGEWVGYRLVTIYEEHIGVTWKEKA